MASSSCPARSDRAFGPRVDPVCRTFDFTILFEDIFFSCVPTAVFFLLLPFHVGVLVKSRAVCSVRSKLLFGKLATLAGLLITQLVFLILRAQKTAAQTSASLAADTLAIFGIISAAWLTYVVHQRSLRSSTLLILYLSAIAILDIPRVRTLWLIKSAGGEAATMTVVLILTAVALLLESMEKNSSIAKEKRFGAPEEYSGLWTRTAFTWLTATFRAGYSRVISQDDLPRLDTRLESHLLRQKLVNAWARYDHQARHSLIKACFHANLFPFLTAIPPRLCKSVFYFAQPLLINTTVSYVGDPTADTHFGRGLIGAWVLVYLGVACSTALTSYQSARFVARVKGGLIGLVYQQTMRARPADLGETTAIALIGTDIERIGFNFLQIHELWASVMEIGVAIWLLEQQVFLACLAPVVVILISIAINVPVSRSAKRAQIAWIERVQARLRITTSVLDDMKGVKMLGLSTVVSNMLHKLREVEIQTSKMYRKLLVWNVLLSECPQNISPLATFGVTVIISLYWKNASLLTAQAFTAIALINLLTNPVIQLVQLMPQLLQCVGSFERIQEYANYANDGALHDDSADFSNLAKSSSIRLQPLFQALPARDDNHEKQHVISLRGSSFAWKKSQPPFLKEIHMNIPRRSITVCVGPVGSGKTMLMKSILGETVCSLGPKPALSRGVPSVAYCAQQPWLEHGTIQSNIIGVTAYEPTWYKTVVWVCQLDADLRVLERGDRTVVGSKGSNLSGGQIQRIALARAVYSRKDTILLDDIFSGMDAHAVDLVSQRLLGTHALLRKHGSTVILATHNLKLIRLADTIVALEDGRIVQSGSPEALLADEGYVAKLGLVLRDEERSSEDHAENTGISRVNVESTLEESFISAPATPDDDINDIPDPRRKTGDWSVYGYYFSSSGRWVVAMFLITMAIWVSCTEFATVWMKWWSEANEDRANKDVGMYLGVYALFSLVGVVAIAISCWIGIVNIISRSASRLHSDLLSSTMRAPLRLFTTTDTGTLTNRFSQDMELIDMQLPLVMINYISTAFLAITKAIILIVYSRYLATMTPFIVMLLYLLQAFYLQTSRQVRLLEIEAKAPLYTHFIESVSGAATIRAYGWQSHYHERNDKFIDESQRPAYLQHCIQAWLGFMLDMIVTIIAAVLVTVVITWKHKFSAGNIGVSLVSVMTFSSVLMRMIKTWTMMESSIGAVARVQRFVAETESEEEEKEEEKSNNREATSSTTVNKNWPSQGTVEFKDLIAAHSPSAAPVIKGITFSVKPSEHIAICGRSGSGKTSTILSLLQLASPLSGQILIDTIDISTLPRPSLRAHFNVVPQSPFLIPGTTMRFNVDPFGHASDDAIIRALQRVRLWALVSEQGGLSKEIDTAMWSAGQKQLLCLARAMVRKSKSKSKILILDEASSSVDAETEAIIQDIIDTTFKDCTVLAVMHRLTHIMRYDKVALLDDGYLVEFDTPARLLLNRTSRFARLYETSGVNA